MLDAFISTRRQPRLAVHEFLIVEHLKNTGKYSVSSLAGQLLGKVFQISCCRIGGLLPSFGVRYSLIFRHLSCSDYAIPSVDGDDKNEAERKKSGNSHHLGKHG